MTPAPGMSTSCIWDVAVVGSGIVGTCAAYHAARNGLKTIKIEQFSFGHKNGSSHGQSRIIRYAHPHPAFIPVVADSYKQIDELEKKRGEKLWIKTGLLWVAGTEYVKKLTTSMKECNCEHEQLTSADIKKRFPFFSYDDKWAAIYDPMGGILLADKWMKAFHEEFLSSGGYFENQCEVQSMNEGELTTLITSKGEIRAKKVIVATGTWIHKLLPELTTKAENWSLSVCYWKTKEDVDDNVVRPENLPVFIVEDQEDNDRGFFMVPEVDYPGTVKFCVDGGDVFLPGEEPDRRDEKFVDIPRKHVAKHFPMLDYRKPAVVDRCKYTMSPDHNYYIDYYGKGKNIVVCGMMSGTGFKVAPGLGRALVYMAEGQPLPFDISFFGGDRFTTGSSHRP